MNNSLRLTVITLLLAVSSLSAATLYVSLGSTNPTPPYTNWATAATSIQAAVNVAAANDAVVVTNGVYPGYVSVTKRADAAERQWPAVHDHQWRRHEPVRLPDRRRKPDWVHPD